MYGPTKPAHWAIIGFAAVAILVLAGLSWATVASLRLERQTRETRAREEFADKRALAMWRMESEAMLALGRESDRWYHEYNAFFSPSSLHFEDNSDPAVTIWQESPLRQTETLEPWIVLHFQFSDHGWTSPQLPSPQRWPRLELPFLSDSESREREELLNRLAGTHDATNRFSEAIADASRLPGSTHSRTIGADQSGRVEALGPRRSDEYLRRRSQVQKFQEASRPPPLECEPAEKVINIVNQQAADQKAGVDPSEFFSVHASPLTPLWLRLEGGDDPELLIVRRVEVGKEVAYQGFIVDWRKLAQSLIPLASDLFDEVRLEPVLSRTEASEPSSRMYALPLRLVVPNPDVAAAASTWTSTRITVAFAWLAALIALGALALGVRSLVALTARRTEFTYAVTHELRTPLTTFQLYTDMLSSGLVPEEKKGMYFQTLNDESRRLSELVAEVLEFSRIESNAVRTNPGAHTVGELLDSVRERYASRCAAAGIQLSLDANGSADRPVHTDLHIALQIVGTLIDNACKYASAPSGVSGPTVPEPPRVRISAQPGPDRLAIEVADNGPGIPQQDRHELFKPFRRGSQAQGSKVGGVGLGLALAKRWSRLIHGNLELVDQGAVRGTCFRLTLPA